MAKFEEVTNSLFCEVEAVIRGMSLFLSIFFATSTAMVCYRPILARDNIVKTPFFRAAVSIGLGVSLILFVLIPLVFQRHVAFLRGDHFCWISSKENNFVALLVLMLHEGVPLLVGFLITLSAYRYAIKQMRELPIHILCEMSVSLRGLLWYPALLLIIFIPSLVDKVWALFNPFRPVWIQTVYLCLTHSIGFINALVYGMQRKLYVARDSHQSLLSNELTSPGQKRISSSSSTSYGGRRETLF